MIKNFLTNFVSDFLTRLNLLFNLLKEMNFILPLIISIGVIAIFFKDIFEFDTVVYLSFFFFATTFLVLFIYDTFISYAIYKFRLFNTLFVSQTFLSDLVKKIIAIFLGDKDLLKPYLEEEADKFIEKYIQNKKIANFFKRKIFQLLINSFVKIVNLVKLLILKILSYILPEKNFKNFFHKYLYIFLSILRMIKDFIIFLLKSMIKILPTMIFIAVLILGIFFLIKNVPELSDTIDIMGALSKTFSSIGSIGLFLLGLFLLTKLIEFIVKYFTFEYLTAMIILFIIYFIFYNIITLLIPIIQSFSIFWKEDMIDNFFFTNDFLNSFGNEIFILLLILSSIFIFKLKPRNLFFKLFSFIYALVIAIFMYLSDYLFIYLLYMYIFSLSEHYLGFKVFYLLLFSLISLIFPTMEIEIRIILIFFLIITDFNQNIKMSTYYVEALKGHYQTLRTII